MVFKTLKPSLFFSLPCISCFFMIPNSGFLLWIQILISHKSRKKKFNSIFFDEGKWTYIIFFRYIATPLTLLDWKNITIYIYIRFFDNYISLQLFIYFYKYWLKFFKLALFLILPPPPKLKFWLCHWYGVKLRLMFNCFNAIFYLRMTIMES